MLMLAESELCQVAFMHDAQISNYMHTWINIVDVIFTEKLVVRST